MAVFLNNGQPTAVFHPCSGMYVEWVVVSEEVPDPATNILGATDSAPSTAAASTNDEEAGKFWSVADNSPSQHDLRSLADGRVWAAPAGHAQAEAMPRKDFEKSAAGSC
jgi:hypothetical protein